MGETQNLPHPDIAHTNASVIYSPPELIHTHTGARA